MINIDLTKILCVDIETAPLPNFNEESPLWDSWVNKNRKQNLDNSELIELYNKEAGLYAEYGKIVCISVGFLNVEKFRIKSISGDEKDIINNFIDVAESFKSKKGNILLLSYNGNNFDLPFIRKRYSKYYPMFQYPRYLSELFTKPWEMDDKSFDVFQVWKGLNFMFSSLAEVAIHHDLPSPKIDTNGSQVAELYNKGEIEKIENYCASDVYITFCILCRWLGEQLPEKVIVSDVDMPTPTILQKAMGNSKIVSHDRIRIDEVINSLTEKEQEIANNIIEAVTSTPKKK